MNVDNNTPERVVRLLICLSFLLVACSERGENPRSQPLVQETGRIENKKLDEASGLARSNRQTDLYWAINDDGPAVIHALNAKGQNLGKVRLNGAKNRDWEDIASFQLDDQPYLLIADIGDNAAKHEYLSLYVVAEPDPGDENIDLAWQINFEYPDAPRDAEALAVDVAKQQVYVLSKRTVPAELYELPLMATADTVITARLAAIVDSLPQPSQAELRDAIGSGWWWQPTAMDFAPDGRSALILTYRGIYYFNRDAGQTWPEVLAGQAMQLALGAIKDAEAISYGIDSQTAVLTVEKEHAPIYQIDLLLQ